MTTETLLKFEEIIAYMLVSRPYMGKTNADIIIEVKALKDKLEGKEVMKGDGLDRILEKEKIIAMIITNRSKLGYSPPDIKTIIDKTMKEIE